MKAYSLYGVGDLRLVDNLKPELKSGWALVKVKACGICSSDIPRIFQNGTYHFPTVPGHEFAGEVVDTADEADRHLIGKRVGVFPLIPCRTCQSCLAHSYETCSNYDYIGSRRDGAFAEYVAVPVWNVIELPDGVPYRLAALCEPLAVAIHALSFADIKGKSVAVIGTGMIGFSLAAAAKAEGAAKVTVVGRSDAKRAIADKLGVDYTVGGITAAADVTVEAVGNSASLETAILGVKSGGTVVVMGNPYGDITLPQKTYWQILRRQLKLVGTWNSRYEKDAPSDWSRAIDMMRYNAEKLDSLITHTFDFDKLPEALALMREHKQDYCKVMITMENDHE